MFEYGTCLYAETDLLQKKSNSSSQFIVKFLLMSNWLCAGIAKKLGEMFIVTWALASFYSVWLGSFDVTNFKFQLRLTLTWL